MKHFRWFALAAWFLCVGIHLSQFTSKPTHGAEWYAAGHDYERIVFVLTRLSLSIAAPCALAAAGYWIWRSRLAVSADVKLTHPPK